MLEEFLEACRIAESVITAHCKQLTQCTNSASESQRYLIWHSVMVHMRHPVGSIACWELALNKSLLLIMRRTSLAFLMHATASHGRSSGSPFIEPDVGLRPGCMRPRCAGMTHLAAHTLHDELHMSVRVLSGLLGSHWSAWPSRFISGRCPAVLRRAACAEACTAPRPAANRTSLARHPKSAQMEDLQQLTLLASGSAHLQPPPSCAGDARPSSRLPGSGGEAAGRRGHAGLVQSVSHRPPSSAQPCTQRQALIVPSSC